ncbi:MAG: UvrD-helicase domain-containing protein, partial [Clostridia bacterium]|nr:UvrD-helicase domain-containing protein [Clostridia bacterium]
KLLGNKNTLELTEQLITFLQSIQAQEDYFALCALPMPVFKRKETIKSGERAQEKELVERVAYYKSAVSALVKEHLGAIAGEEEEETRFNGAARLAALLAEIILRFDEVYTELKREQAKLDYNDLEHITLELLSVPAIAEEVRGKYDYVFVDEYQDINPVQERIISAVSGENVFLVGDVKQSIYAFRGSKSIYFNQKQAEYEKAGSSLYLTSNFRSGREILAAVNRVFCLAMTARSCGIPYAQKPMSGGDGYGENGGRVAVHLVREEEKESVSRGVYSVMEEYERAKTEREDNAEAKEVLKIIEAELHSQYYDPDEKRFRAVTYGDIAVLSRKKSGTIASIIRYLSENGVPVATANKVNICAYPEIRQLVDILSLIDNRQQDVALCSALLSGMGGLTNAELAEIRIRFNAKGRTFRVCAELYSRLENDTAQKLKAFYAMLDKYAALSCILSAGELIQRLVAEAKLEIEWLARGDGARRVGRIRAFALQAQDKNLHEFLIYLRSLDYELPLGANDGENAVKVLTMHASKGLEYPVVILGALSENFHGDDADEVLYSENYTLAPRYYNLEKRLVYGTLLRNLIKMENREEELKGELNLLYVAMTRAKYALHLLINEKDAAQYADPLYAKKYAELLPLYCFEGQIIESAELSPFERRQAIVTGVNDGLVEDILSSFRRPYPYAIDVSLPVKSSATEILQTNREQEEYYPGYRLVPEEKTDVKKTEIGTAYHAFLEHADFAKNGREELERMQKNGVLPSEQLSLLSAEKTEKILSMSVFKRLQGAELHREQPFMVMLPVKEIFGAQSEEKTLFQGFIDLLAITPQGVEIVDYKYSFHTAEELKGRYAQQITLYKKAVATIMKIKEEGIRTTLVNVQTLQEIEL